MQKIKNFKITIPLTPVQLIWLHSHHHFMKVEQETKINKTEIKFYKVNHGVEIRFQNVDEEPNYAVIENAKAEIEKIISDNQIRLLDVSYTRNVYVKIAKEARKQFANTYIIFLHYETFENCCKKLNEKFSVASTSAQFQALKRQNRHFCFLICDKKKFNQVFNYTQKLLNLEISCASTSISGKKQYSLEAETISVYKRAHSVTSLRGSFTSCENDTHTEPEQRLSLNNSEAGEEIYQIGEAVVLNLSLSNLKDIKRSKIYGGSEIDVEFFQGSYLDIKKRLYYANRLQIFANPFLQEVYAYGIGENSASNWWINFIVEKTESSLKDKIHKSVFHNHRNKIQLVYRIGKCIEFLHKNMETHGHIIAENVKFDSEGRLMLSGIPNKNIPPHTNPFEYDIRLFLILVYWILTLVHLSYEALLKKIQNKDLLFTMYDKCKNVELGKLLRLSNCLLKRELDLEEYLQEIHKLLLSFK